MKRKISFTYHHLGRDKISNILLKKHYSDNNIYYLIKEQHVLVNNKIIKDKNYIVPFYSTIQVTLNDEINELPIINKPIDIIYEDDYLLIVNKPYNLDIEPTKSNYEETLASYIGNYFKENEINSKIHFINRIDKLTSGLVIIAKNQYIHNLFKNVKIQKYYECLVKGKTNKKGTIKINIAKDTLTNKRIVSENGKLCITKYELLRYENDNSLLKVRILTGRTHQIRVSMQFINHPLVNDNLYGTIEDQTGMYLKAKEIKFKHPITHKKIHIII